MDRFLDSLHQGQYAGMIESVVKRNISPYEAVNSLLDKK
jgi:hypothetical protein